MPKRSVSTSRRAVERRYPFRNLLTSAIVWEKRHVVRQTCLPPLPLSVAVGEPWAAAAVIAVSPQRNVLPARPGAMPGHSGRGSAVQRAGWLAAGCTQACIL
eukprot:COSAG01_NODE_36637_length_514_cov_2.040964_1_plen_101_part_01